MLASRLNWALHTAIAAGVALCSCDIRKSADHAITTDDESVSAGQATFNRDCSGCHNFRQDGIGPQLGGLTDVVAPEWIATFIKDPRAVARSGDERAQMLFEKYSTLMPPFTHYSDEELSSLLAFLNTQPAPMLADDVNLQPILDPIPSPIIMSDLVLGLEPYTKMPFSTDATPRTRIVKLDFRPDTHENFIVDLQGQLYRIVNNKPVLYFDIAVLRPNFIDKPGRATGFGSFAFHPEFASNGLLYTTHTEAPGSANPDFAYPDSIKVTVQWVLTEWRTSTPSNTTFSGDSRELFRVNMVTGIHGVQEVTFNPLAAREDADYGLLYVGIGDGGCAGEGFPFVTHDPGKIWGTIIRIDPMSRNSSNGKYGIPASNPFAGTKKGLGEVFAYGFRNPHRITWSRSGAILSSNIGQHQIEALNIITSGSDYGWPIREGTFLMNPIGDMGKIYPLPEDDEPYHITYPVAQYDHDEGKAISGGFEYWGSSVPELNGKYVFGDLNNGRLFYVLMSELKLGSQATIYEWRPLLNGKVRTLADLCGEEWVHLRLGRDAVGELYIMTKPDGMVYKLVSQSQL